MQHFTNEHIFYKEQQDCMQEGIPLVDFDYKSNQNILDTFLEVCLFRIVEKLHNLLIELMLHTEIIRPAR